MTVEMREGWFGVTRGGDVRGPLVAVRKEAGDFEVDGNAHAPNIWFASGRYFRGKKSPHDIIATFPTRAEAEAYLRGGPEGKTLAELDVKPGDVVRCVWTEAAWWTVGKTYTAYDHYGKVRVNSDDSDFWENPKMARFTLVSRASTPPDTSRQERWDRFAAAIATGTYSFHGMMQTRAPDLAKDAEVIALAADALMAEADKRMGG